MIRETNLAEGAIFKKLIWFSLPMIAGNILQQIYNLVDTLVVGRFIGSDALAAVGSSYTLMTFITSVIIGLCMGSGAFFSMDYGSGDRKRLKEDTWVSFCFILAVTCIIYCIIYPCMDGIMRLLNTPEEIMEQASDYVLVVFSGTIFVFLYNFFAYLLRGMGNSAVPLIFLGISSAVNVALDIWFVAGLGFGVKGAAAATVIAQCFSGAGIGIYTLCRIPGLKPEKGDLKSGLARLGKIAYNDFATSAQQSVMNFGILMIQGLVNSFGVNVMAAFAAAVKIDTIAYMPAQEFGNGYSLFVSQNYGAGKDARIKAGTKMAMTASAVFCIMVSVVIFAAAESLMSVFVGGGEGEIIAEGARYLRIEGSAYIGIGILFLWYGYYRGIGRPHISLILTVISLGTRVALSYALAPNTPLGVTAIWISIPVGWILADAAGFVIYGKNNRR